MTTLPAAVVALAVLSVAGLFPVLALVGVRWITAPLAPLAGAAIAGLAATCALGAGGPFMAWFTVGGVLGVVGALVIWHVRPARRPSFPSGPNGPDFPRGYRAAGMTGAVAVVAACVWNLRSLGTPTIGFDARAVWLLRAGWFLQSHHRLLIDMRSIDVPLYQSTYPPLVSAVAAVASGVTGDPSLRLGVVVVAVLNACVLATVALALVDCGRGSLLRLVAQGRHSPAGDGEGPGGRAAPLAPAAVGIAAAVLVVFVAFGITGPFMTDGYADPIWSLAAVGAVVYGLQIQDGWSNRAVAALLVVVAGMSKNEGLAVASGLVVLIAARSVLAVPGADRRRRWFRPVLVAVLELAVIGAWPGVLRLVHARGLGSTRSPVGEWLSRTHATVQGMAPYLHVLVLAVPLAVVGGVCLSRVRRRTGVANDLWAWVGLAWGAVAIVGAFVTATSDIPVWLLTTVNRVTEFPALMAWWIVALWAVVASAAPASARLSDGEPWPGPEAPVSDPAGDQATAPVGDRAAERTAPLLSPGPVE